MRSALLRLTILLFFSVFLSASTFGQDWQTQHLNGLKFRSIGPAFMSGRIADIAIHPENENIWYVAAASGGVWKTSNAGVTWTPVFDDQPSYSIGCVTIDPSNPNTVWVGTGENVGGRHIGFGDGLYRSRDGGSTWQHMGLKHSEHISKIVIHPRNSKLMWVASQGPLWSPGGERGLYRSSDGGKTWTRTLGDDLWTGVTDLLIDPRNPNRLYAATWQRHRTIAAYLGGGPKSGIHRSDDGGLTWERLENGLPDSNMGKIGLAISPQQPDTVYAAIELNRRAGGVFRSTDGGGTWEKRSDTVSGGTGPHYYQELYASPHKYDLIYLCDVRIQVSYDGGRTFARLSEKNKHSDNHAMAFRKSDPGYLLVGSDGGVYESFDHARNWRFMENLPLTQFYKIAIDDAEPFYNVYGGTQDNSTEGGPIRTDNGHGIQNSDWKVVLDWDGHQPATEPGNPDILYAERQQGFLARVDLTTGEIVDIQPQPAEGEDYERFNWDAPILVSPHEPTRLYFASQRVWRSDNRGGKWTPISGDLTRDQNRIQLPILGAPQGWDNAWDMFAMSNFNTITSLAESPQKEGLIYVGTDDGLIQVTEDGGENWTRTEVRSLPGCPEHAFINDIRADLHDEGTVYIALDNHKYGDYRPYFYVSRDKGKTWSSLTGGLPERLLVWRLVQDHVEPNLMFLATEFGIYTTLNAGQSWVRMKSGLPTISFRDIKIHRRENDLVAASFGRGIYVLDDLSPLREMANTKTTRPALFQPRTALWYFERPHLGFDGGKGDQGASHYIAPNPEFGATFTYHLPKSYLSKSEQRSELEKSNQKKGAGSHVPDWSVLEAESASAAPVVWLNVTDEEDRLIRRLKAPATEGTHRVTWDLRYPTPNVIKLIPDPPPMWGGPPRGLMVAPGTYKVSLWMEDNGTVELLADARTFEVKPLRSGALEGSSPEDVAKFWREYEQAVRTQTAMAVAFANAQAKLARMRAAIEQSQGEIQVLLQQYADVAKRIHALDRQLNGDVTKRQVGEKVRPTIAERIGSVGRGVDRSTFGPTETHRTSLEIANREMQLRLAELRQAAEALSELANEIAANGGPHIETESLSNLESK